MRLFGCVLAFLAWASPALGEMDAALDQVLNSLDLTALEQTMGQSGDLRAFLMALARGETVISAQGVWETLIARGREALFGSLKRLGALVVPALITGISGGLGSREEAAESCHYACFLMAAVVMAKDLGACTALCRETVNAMANAMQSLFPVLLALLAAVGGTASASFFQPAVVAASGSMTALIRQVTLPLAAAAALTTLISHMSRGMSTGRLSVLLRKAAAWTLGISFTVFLGVTLIQGVGTAGVDGISIRTAKYAIDHLVPFVGGMFADTVDTLVGCSLLIKNALGVTGLVLLAGIALGPALEVLAAALAYRVCSAILQPVAESRLLRCMDDYAQALMLLFVVILSMGAMFILLIAQMLVVGNLTVMLR